MHHTIIVIFAKSRCFFYPPSYSLPVATSFPTPFRCCIGRILENNIDSVSERNITRSRNFTPINTLQLPQTRGFCAVRKPSTRVDGVNAFRLWNLNTTFLYHWYDRSRWPEIPVTRSDCSPLAIPSWSYRNCESDVWRTLLLYDMCTGVGSHESQTRNFGRIHPHKHTILFYMFFLLA